MTHSPRHNVGSIADPHWVVDEEHYLNLVADADHFFQLSGQYLKRANDAEAELAAQKEHYRVLEEEMLVVNDERLCATLDAKENMEIANEFKKLMEQYRQHAEAAYVESARLYTREELLAKGMEYATAFEREAMQPKKEWVGLTDGEILEMFGVVGTSGSDINPRGLLKDTRRIEAKLKEKNT